MTQHSAVVFETPGLIDIQSFTTFGINSKPNSSSPIGFFGTGLKYAIAVLVREKIRVQLFIGETEYEFYQKPTKFRDKVFNTVAMKKRRGMFARWQYTNLPFTTELGKNWKLWQAYRELYTNTIDENGRIYQEDGLGDADIYFRAADYTFINVFGDAFLEEHSKKFELFLPSIGHYTNNTGLNKDMELIKQPSKYVYWRGMRCYDLPKDQPAIYTWNILSYMELTEDRTLKYAFYIHQAIVNYVVQCDDEHLIKQVIKATKNHEIKFLENNLDWSMVSVPPGPTFNQIMAEEQKTGYHRVSSSSREYYQRYNPNPVKVPHGLWWLVCAQLIRGDEFSTAADIMEEHADELVLMLESYKRDEKENVPTEPEPLDALAKALDSDLTLLGPSDLTPLGDIPF